MSGWTKQWLAALALAAIPAAAGGETSQPGVNSGKETAETTCGGGERAAGEYRIGPGDVLQVDVWKEPDASSPSVVVRPDGKLSLPFIGERQATGLSPAELQNELSSAYNRVIRNARVTVIVKEVHSQRVYLIGEVRRQGPIRLASPITVLQALAESGGLTDYAKTKKIYVLRESAEGQMILPFDYDAVVRGQKVEQNVVLRPGDTIVVPR